MDNVRSVCWFHVQMITYCIHCGPGVRRHMVALLRETRHHVALLTTTLRWRLTRTALSTRIPVLTVKFMKGVGQHPL